MNMDMDARQILLHLGKPDATAISLSDVADSTRIFAQMKFNGDGIVPADSTEEPQLQAVITDLINTLGAETHRSGKPGVSQPKVDAFFAQLSTFDAWAAKAEVEAASVMLLGSGTPEAVAAFQAVRARVDDYFARCASTSWFRSSARRKPSLPPKNGSRSLPGLRPIKPCACPRKATQRTGHRRFASEAFRRLMMRTRSWKRA